jgi:hypothetical protein
MKGLTCRSIRTSILLWPFGSSLMVTSSPTGSTRPSLVPPLADTSGWPDSSATTNDTLYWHVPRLINEPTIHYLLSDPLADGSRRLSLVSCSRNFPSDATPTTHLDRGRLAEVWPPHSCAGLDREDGPGPPTRLPYNPPRTTSLTPIGKSAAFRRRTRLVARATGPLRWGLLRRPPPAHMLWPYLRVGRWVTFSWTRFSQWQPAHITDLPPRSTADHSIVSAGARLMTAKHVHGHLPGREVRHRSGFSDWPLKVAFRG